MDRLRNRRHLRGRRGAARRILVILVGATAGVTTAWASNGLVNPHFDSGVSGWSTPDGSLSWSSGVDVDGCPGSGSALASNPDLVNGYWTITFVSAGSCVPTVDGKAPIYDIHVMAGASIQETNFALLGYTDDTCANGETELSISGYGPLPPGWYRFQFGLALSSSIKGIRALVRARDVTVSSYSYNFDSIYLGYDDPVFLDDFEAGSTCRWSTVVASFAAID